MRQTILLASGNLFSVNEIHIFGHDTAWTVPERCDRYRLTFVRSGTYRVRTPGLNELVDPVVAYVTCPGQEHQIAHKLGAEDLCTSVLVPESFLDEVAGVCPPVKDRLIFTTGSVDLAHRALVARSRRHADAFELEERVISLVGDTLGDEACPAARDAALNGHTTRQRVVERAREALVSHPAESGLRNLADRVGVSPYYLSRSFRQETGETLSRFRNRVRIRYALERIEAGEEDLTALASELGFSDHPHFTRTMRQEVGAAPTGVRRAFSSGDDHEVPVICQLSK